MNEKKGGRGGKGREGEGSRVRKGERGPGIKGGEGREGEGRRGIKRKRGRRELNVNV